MKKIKVKSRKVYEISLIVILAVAFMMPAANVFANEENEDSINDEILIPFKNPIGFILLSLIVTPNSRDIIAINPITINIL